MTPTKPDPEEPRPFTLRLDLTTALILLAVGAFTLLALAVVVGLIRNSLNLTSVVSILATMFGGVVAGILAAQRTAAKPDEKPGDKTEVAP